MRLIVMLIIRNLHILVLSITIRVFVLVLTLLVDLDSARLLVGAQLVVGHTDVVPLVVLAGLVHLEPPGHLVLLGTPAGHDGDSHIIPYITQRR